MTEQRGSFVEWLATKQAEPKVITVQRFACQFCHRGHSTRKAAEQHIARCWKNPGVHGCKTCAHYQPGFRSFDYCVPGQQCSCNDFDESCTHRDGPEEIEGPITGCPLWELRGAAS